MSKIVPAILEQNLSDIVLKLKQVSGLVDLVQIDICDGDFVPSKTYASAGERRSLSALANNTHKRGLALELDMMVDFDCTGCMTKWSQVLAEAKPEKVIFHLGSTYRWDELFTRIRSATKNKKVPFTCGLAIRISHTRAEVRKVLESHSEFEYIQLMGINKVGHSGQRLAPEVYDRIKRLRRAFPDVPIQIDGGVKLANANELVSVGATRLGMNSGLYKTKNIKETVEIVNDM